MHPARRSLVPSPSARPTPKPAPKADVADYGKPGEARELVPVRGKITIFDFWATWCKPCKELEPALVALAKAHPELVAIRRVDVVDWDSPAVAKHLTPKRLRPPAPQDLRSDRRGWCSSASSNTGGLAALIRDVRALVEAEAKKRTK